MADDADPVDSEERSSAEFTVVDPIPKRPVSVTQREQDQLHPLVAGELLADHIHNHFGDAFSDFQNDITVKPVADDDIYLSFEDIVALDVADKGRQVFFHEEVRLAGELVALARLRAVR